MKRMLFISLTVLLFCYSTGKIAAYSDPHLATSDSLFISNDTFAVLPWPATIKGVTGTASRPSTITYNELGNIKRILTKAVFDFDSTNSSQYVSPLPAYRVQLVPYLDSNGEKKVWVNCFCRDAEIDGPWFKNWKERVILVCDGGECFFNLTISLTKGTVYNFRVNGLG